MPAANTLRGWGGNDVLLGALGNDFLSGGLGQDYFVFNTALGGTNRDGIVDFTVADDTIRLENAIFTASATTGTLAAAAFWSNTTGLPTTQATASFTIPSKANCSTMPTARAASQAYSLPP